MLYCFDKLITRCIHGLKFTNRLNEKKVRCIFSEVFQKLTEYSAYSLNDIKEVDKHFHYLTPKEIDLVVKEILPQQWNTKYLTSYLRSYQVCQMSVGTQEERLVGIIEKVNNSAKHLGRNYLFSPLFFDFEHSLHPNLKKKKLKDNALICIMKAENCN